MDYAYHIPLPSQFSFSLPTSFPILLPLPLHIHLQQTRRSLSHCPALLPIDFSHFSWALFNLLRWPFWLFFFSFSNFLYIPRLIAIFCILPSILSIFYTFFSLVSLLLVFEMTWNDDVRSTKQSLCVLVVTCYTIPFMSANSFPSKYAKWNHIIFVPCRSISIYRVVCLIFVDFFNWIYASLSHIPQWLLLLLFLLYLADTKKSRSF